MTAFERARDGGGPTLIEAKVVRRQGHWAGDPQLYRDIEADLQKYRDPLDVLRTSIDLTAADALDADAAAEVQRAYEAAVAAPEPSDSVIWQYLYYEQ